MIIDVPIFQHIRIIPVLLLEVTGKVQTTGPSFHFLLAGLSTAQKY